VGSSSKTWAEGRFYDLYCKGTPWIDVRIYGETTGFALAVAAIGATSSVLYIPNEQSVTGDVTVPATLTLKFSPGGFLGIATGVTVTINGNIDAGLTKIFSCAGTGKVVFGAGAVKEVYPQWWGASPSASAAINTAAIQAAIDSTPLGGKVYFPMGIYSYTGIIIRPGVNLKGSGWWRSSAGVSSGTVLMNVSTVGEHAITFDNSVVHVMGTSIDDLVVNGNLLSGDGLHIVGNAEIPAVTELTVNHCLIRGNGGWGNRIKWSWAITFNGCHIIENALGGSLLEINANAVSFFGCHTQGNFGCGLKGTEFTGLTYIGGAIEGNSNGSTAYNEIDLSGGMINIQTYIEGLTAPVLINLGVCDGISIKGSWLSFTAEQTAIKAYGINGYPVKGLSVSGNIFRGIAGGTAVNLVEFVRDAQIGPNSLVGTITNRLLYGTTQVSFIDHGHESDNNFQLNNKLSLGAPALLIIAAGLISVIKSYHKIHTEADAATDDLNTINGGSDGMILTLKRFAAGYTVVVKHSTGNIILDGGADCSLITANDRLMLQYDLEEAKWFEISRTT